MISWFEKHDKLSWAVTFLIAAAIFYVSSLTFESSGTGTGTNIRAILYHILAFFFLAFFLMISLVKGEQKKFFLLAIPIAILYGISDELHQFFVPGRYNSLFDVFLDSVGIVFAFMVYMISVEWRNGRKIGKGE